ncbi:MAG: discoidin domain-containing protein, partial [Acidimicrobiia bacterium]
STSSGLPQWLQYDFGAGNDVEVYEIEMWAQDGLVDRAPDTFDVQYSDDGSSWTTAWSEAGVSDWVSGTPKVFTRSGFPGISYGYWRIRITDNNGDALTAAGELEFRDAAGVAQQATGGRPVFSSQYATSGANSAASAFDDDIGTEWVSESGVALPHFIGYAFGETREPVEVYLVAQNNDIGADRSPRDIEIQYSEDGSTWETFDSHTDLTFAAGEAKTFGLNWTVLPDTPTLSLVGSPTESTQEVEGTAFSESEDGVSFAQAQYQAATDEGFSTIVYDETSGDPPENGHTLSGLGDNREHWARVRYQNDQDEWSEWSNVVSFTTLEIVPFSGPKLCSLVLEVYKEDGETIAWEVGTDPTHPRPYLAVPS